MDELLRYTRNLGPITAQEQHILQNARVFVAGCGGLGGYLAEYLARLGVGSITLADADRFDETNLNRQLFSTENNLGCSKAAEAKKRLDAINSSIQVHALEGFITESNAPALVAGHDLVLDALDTPAGKRMLQTVCCNTRIPLIHGAVEGWFGQVTTVLPGDDSLSRLYPCPNVSSSKEGTLSFAPALIASIQAAEALKLLLGKPCALRGKVLFADLLANRFDIMPI